MANLAGETTIIMTGADMQQIVGGAFDYGPFRNLTVKRVKENDFGDFVIDFEPAPQPEKDTE